MAAPIEFQVLVNTQQLQKVRDEARGLQRLLRQAGSGPQAELAGVFSKSFENQVGVLQQKLRELEQSFINVNAKAAQGRGVGGKDLIGAGATAINANFAQGQEATSAQIQQVLRRSLLETSQQLKQFVGEQANVNQGLIRQFVDGLPPLESALLSAFQGFGRRFRATLQFAISGALIFSFQRLVREAFTTAVEVERAFADIATALEFDTDAGRGTAQFSAELEKIRVGALAIADEFNALPTQVNRVAFQMVSRFRESANALAATRAQIIALKVSTIDTEEILRALTATAESFALATIKVNDSLDLQERILRRENAAVAIYAQALDLAVQIQQEWGVSLEDTVEGTGRSAEVFRQLGFTMEETAGIVASVVQFLGGTGSQAAERLNRSIGQITSPQIRDQLLDLAAANETFTLTFADFENGATALEALSSQFERLQEIDPSTANRIAQIVGQRRETEVVAAVLSQRDFQKQVADAANDAAGAAERRFSFLEQTLSEILASIGSQFEELATNFSELGALSPFKLILKTADQFLNILNEILKVINGVVTAMQSIPLIGGLFKDILPNLIAAGLALRLIKRTLDAIVVVQGLQVVQSVAQGAAAVTGRAAAGAVTRSTGLVDARGNALVVTTAASALALSKLTTVLTKFGTFMERIIFGSGRLLTKAFITAQVALSGLTFATINQTRAAIRESIRSAVTGGSGFLVGALGKGGAAATGIATALLGTAFLIQQFGSAVSIGTRELAEFNKALSEIESDIRRRNLAGDITDVEAASELSEARFRLTGEREAPGTTATATQNVLTSGIGVLVFAALNEEFRETLLNGPEVKRRLQLTGVGDNILSQLFAILAPTVNRRALLPGSAENIRTTQNIIFQDDTGPDQLRLLREQILEISPALREDQTKGLLDQAAGLGLRLSLAGDNEEIEAIIIEFANFADTVDEVARKAGATAEGLQETLKSLQNDLNTISQDLEFGRISPGSAARRFAEVQDKALQQAEFAESLGFTEEAQAFRDKASSALRSTSQAIQQQFDERIEILALFGDDEGSLEKSIDLLKQKVAALRIAGDLAAARSAGIELIQAQRSLVEFLIKEATEEAAFRDRWSRSAEERAESQRKLAREILLIATLNLVLGRINIREFEAFARQAGEAALTAARITEDITVRRAVVAAQGQGPILSDLTRINAELVRLRKTRALSRGVEVLELTQEINQLIAEQAQEMLRRAASAVLLQAGVNDSMKALQAQITINAQEMQLTAQLFGKSSSQFNDLALKQEQLKNALAQASLELRDLERRLDSDITNAFEQAQLDLIAVLEQLQAPDLGELEKAKLLLEKKNAEAAARRSFFDDRLFQLQFDFETGEIGVSSYIAALERLLATVDTTTQAGKEIFLQIQGVIDGLTDDVSDLRFNIPQAIRLPTIFEIRRSLAADQLGVNYLDNRQQQININVANEVDFQRVLDLINNEFANTNNVTAGAAGITVGPF